MTRIRATCPTCGEVDLGPEEIYLAIRDEESSYRFLCPICEATVLKRADRKVVALLLSAGVNLGDGLPAEPSIRPECEDLPPFGTADIRAFRQLLHADGFLERLAEGA